MAKKIIKNQDGATILCGGLERSIWTLGLSLGLGAATFTGVASQTYAQDSQLDSESEVKTIDDSDMSRFLPRIVGGDIAQENYPWMISLQRILVGGGSRHICGGSFIDTRWVLTAAHCVFGVAPANFRIVGNVNQLDDPDADVFEVKNIHVHEDYNPNTLLNDIALIELAEPAVGQGLVETADENYMATVEEDDLVTVIGWGALEQGNPNLPNDLYEVDVPVRTQPQCLTAYPGAPSIIAGDTICAGIDAGGIDSCQGDSGGPLFQADGQGYRQVGIVSWGQGCALPGKYGVYTRVASHEDWINSFVQGAFFEGAPFVGYLGVNTTVSQNIQIRNNGEDPVNTLDVSLEGANAQNFAVDGTDCTGAAIAPGQVCNVTVSATSAIAGDLAATVVATLDSAITPEVSFDVFATALPIAADGPAALDTNDALVFSGGDVVWSGQTDNLAEGGQSLKSGDIDDNQISVATAVVQGPGTVSFSYSVSSEQNYDKLLVLHNGELIVDASGEIAFTEVTRDLVPGENHFTFGYLKDVSETVGADAAWVDNMVVTLDETPPPPPPDPEIGVDPEDPEEEEEPVDEEDPDAVAASTTFLQILGFLALVLVRGAFGTRQIRRRR